MRLPHLSNLATWLCSLTLAGPLLNSAAADDADPFIGRWALTIPGGGAGWLGVTKEQGFFDASILWGGGSVLPVDNVFFQGSRMLITRSREVKRKDATGKVVRTQRLTELITAQVDGDRLSLNITSPNEDGRGINSDSFDGKRIPALPQKPDLSQVKFGDPIALYNGKNLDGWKLTDPNAVSGWRVQDGVLMNRPVQEQGKPHKNYGNLRTERELEDFNLQAEVRVDKGGNSGIYLRGIYEVQVTESYGRQRDSHNMGAVYSRITPSVTAEKPPGEWQTLDITLVDRHITVVLNGQKIIDNEPLQGCTGGALTSDEFKPGPIYIQGDHTDVDYRKLVLRPVVKR